MTASHRLFFSCRDESGKGMHAPPQLLGRSVYDDVVLQYAILRQQGYEASTFIKVSMTRLVKMS